MQRSSVRHWSERVWKKPRNTPGSFACFFQAFAAQLIAEIHSSYLTDSGETLLSRRLAIFPPLNKKVVCGASHGFFSGFVGPYPYRFFYGRYEDFPVTDFPCFGRFDDCREGAFQSRVGYH